MKIKSILFIASAAILAIGCKNKTSNNKNNAFVNITISPEAGYGATDGRPVDTKVSYPESYDPDSIVYYLDSVKFAVKKDSSVVTIKTDTLRMGQRIIVAKVYKNGEIRNVTTNFYKAPVQMPEQLNYNVIRKFPHDTTANTEGLSYQDGYLYETTGDSLHSDIRKVELETGKVLVRQKIGAKYYAKGNTVIGDKVVVFISKEKFGLLFDKNTLKPLGKFDRVIGAAGWGVTNDGNKLYFDDGGSNIWLLDKNNYSKRGILEILDHEARVEQINELEYVDGKIYTNVYGYDTIVIIDAKTGGILQSINMTNIWPYKDRPKKFDNETNVLNGIAWDAKGKRLFVTGKKWAFVYQIEITKGLPVSIVPVNR